MSGSHFRQGVEYFDGRMCLAFDDGPNECSENSEDQPVSFLFGTYEEILEGFSTVIFSGAPAGET